MPTFLDPGNIAVNLIYDPPKVHSARFRSYNNKGKGGGSEGNAFGMSSAVIEENGGAVFVIKGYSDFISKSPKVAALPTKSTVFNIASISKTFTAAAFLRMIEEERYQKIFNLGIETKLSSRQIIDALKSRYPDVNYIQSGLEKEEDFDKITLRDLLQHTSGIADINLDSNQIKKFRSNPNIKLAEGEIFSYPRYQRFGFGNYQYSNLGYELLGMIIAAAEEVTSDSQEKYKPGQMKTFGEVVRKFVIEPLKLKFTFTPDQMRTIDKNGVRRVEVIDRPSEDVAQSYDYFDGFLNLSQGFNYDQSGAGGMYSTPEDVSRFALAFFSNEVGRFFKKLQTIKIRDTKPIPIPIFDKDKQPVRDNAGEIIYDKMGYSIGHQVLISDPRHKAHGGADFGFHSYLYYFEGQASTAIVVWENLTPPLVNTILSKGKFSESVDAIDDEFREEQKITTDRLVKNYSHDELLKMRQMLDKTSPKEFFKFYQLQESERVKNKGKKRKKISVTKNNFSGNNKKK